MVARRRRPLPPLRPGFLHPDAVILAGQSTNPDFDIAQLQAEQEVQEHSFSARVDFRMANNWSSYVRVFHDQGTSDQPEGVTGAKCISPPTRATRCSICRAS